MKLPALLSPILLLRRGDLPGLLFVGVVLAVVVYISVKPPGLPAKDWVGSAFGADWDCQYVASGEDVCIKNVRRRQSN